MKKKDMFFKNIFCMKSDKNGCGTTVAEFSPSIDNEPCCPVFVFGAPMFWAFPGYVGIFLFSSIRINILRPFGNVWAGKMLTNKTKNKYGNKESSKEGCR